MESEFKSSYYAHLLKVILILIILGAGVVGARMLFAPDDFGKYGHFRAGAVEDEMNLPIRNQTNDSCLQCHPFIKKIHLKGIHKTVSCEFCHGPNGDHIENGKKIASMPTKRGEEIRDLCLRCHNKIIRARPEESIKMVSMPQHLEEKKVRVDHVCNQCHQVHAPMKWVNEARQSMGLLKEEEKK